MTGKELLRLMLQGGPGFCQIAVTNACNASCRFCSFPQVAPGGRVMADPARLFRGLEVLRDKGVHYLCFTGGEPLLYPALLPALGRARDLGIHTLLCTNGSLLTPAYIRDLKTAGLETLIISMDGPTAAAHDAHRGLPGLTGHIREMLPQMRRAGLNPVASVTLSRLIGDLGEMLRFLEELGFRRVTFSYPITRLNSSYLGFADHYSVDFTPAELYQWFSRVKEFKASDLSPHPQSPAGLERSSSGSLRAAPPAFPAWRGTSICSWTGISRFFAAIIWTSPWVPWKISARFRPSGTIATPAPSTATATPASTSTWRCRWPIPWRPCAGADGSRAWAPCCTPTTFSPWPPCWRAATGCEAELWNWGRGGEGA